MLKRVFAMLTVPIILFAYTEGNVDKGHTYYRFIIGPMIGLKGDVFTKKHTKKEWEKLFFNNAKEFKKSYASSNEKLKNFTSTTKFQKIIPHLKAFAIYYAKDSQIKPICGN